MPYMLIIAVNFPNVFPCSWACVWSTPALPGIGGRHADPKVTVQMDTYAVDGLKSEQIHYLYAPTHLNPTYEYGVSFERGTYVDYGDRRQVFISGTASINNKGEVVYPRGYTKPPL